MHSFAKFILGLTILFSTTTLFAQAVHPPLDSNKQVQIINGHEVYEFVDQMPEYPGGTSALMKYMRHNVHYPKKARSKKIEGTVLVQFIIDNDGEVEDVKTISKKFGGGLEEEALRVIKKMPRWKPGSQKGQKVRVQYTFPIRFHLTENKRKRKR